VKVLKPRLDGTKVKKFWWVFWLGLSGFSLLNSAYFFDGEWSDLLAQEIFLRLFASFLLAQVLFILALLFFLFLYRRCEKLILIPDDTTNPIDFKDLIVLDEVQYIRVIYLPPASCADYLVVSYEQRNLDCEYPLSLIVADRIWKLQILLVVVWAGTPQQAFEFWQKNGILKPVELKQALRLELDRMDGDCMWRIKNLHPSQLGSMPTSQIRKHQETELEKIIREHLETFESERAVRITKVSFLETTE